VPRSAEVRARIVQEGNKIKVSFEDHDFGSITFNEDTGASGPKAYGKLIRILDVQQAMAKDKKGKE
jgi:hypothetical protein